MCDGETARCGGIVPFERLHVTTRIQHDDGQWFQIHLLATRHDALDDLAGAAQVDFGH